MATNDRFEGDNASFLNRFISSTVGVAGIGAASHRMWKSIDSNRPIKSAASRTGTALGSVLEDVGRQVKTQQTARTRDQLTMAGELVDSITKIDYLRKISETVEQSTALLNSILTTVDDPSTGLDRVLSPSVRDEIVNLMQRLSETNDPTELRNDMEKAVGGFVSALAGGPEKNRVVWARHLNESRGIAQDLIAPRRISGVGKTHQGFLSLDEAFDDEAFKGMSNTTKDNIKRSLARLNTRALDGGTVKLANDSGSLYAQVFRSRGEREELVFNYPLHLGDKHPGSVISGKPLTYRSSADFDFGWRFGRAGIDAGKLKKVAAAAGNIPLHGIPMALTKQHRALLGSVREQMAASSNPMEVIDDLIIKNSKAKSLRRMNAKQWMTYLQATSGLAPKDLPTISAAMVSTEEMIQNVLINKLGVTGRNSIWSLDPKRLNEETQSLGIPNARVYGSSGGALGQHVKKAYAFDQNFLKVFGMESVDEVFNQQILRELNVNPYFDSSASPGRLLHTTNINGRNRVTADVGLLKNSPIHNIQFSARSLFFDEDGSTVGSDVLLRSYLPKTARLEQITGRPRMFAGPVVEANNGFKLGAADPVGWNQALTGTSNKAFIMVADPGDIEDEAAAFFKKLESTGQVFHSGEEILLEQETFKVMDPEQTKKGMGRLLEAASGGKPVHLPFRDGSYYLGDERLGSFVGYDNRNEQVHVRTDPDTLDAVFRLETRSVKNKKGEDVRTIIGIMDKRRRMPQYKGFSSMHKGMFQQISRDVMNSDLDRIGATPLVDQLATGLGLAPNALRQHLAYGAADTVKKGHLFWDQQITSAFQMLGGDPRALAERTRTYGANAKTNDDILGSVVKSFLELANDANMDSRAVGHVLAGVASKSFTKGANPIHQIINSSPYSVSKDFHEGIASRVFFGASAVAPGEGVGDYGAARASMDRRQMSVFGTRLKSMGMDDTVIKSVMGDIAGRMDFASESATSAKGLMGIVREARGIGRLSQAADNTPVLSVNQLFSMMGDDTLDEFLGRQTSPLKLSFAAQDGAMVSDRQIAAATKNILGSEAITLPTGDLFEAMSGTVIKEGDGPARQVSGEFTSGLGHFLGYLKKYMGSPIEAPQEELNTVIKSWQQDLIHLAAKTQVDSLGGKLKGSMMLPIFSYDMSELGGAKGFSSRSFGLKSSQVNFIQSAQSLSGGRAVFLDDQAFLGLLKQYRQVSSEDAAKKAERFFLGAFGLETRGHLQGISGFAVRQPVLGAGHVAPIQVFRHQGPEAGDAILERFKASLPGKYDDVTSWHQLAHMPGNKNTGVKRQFFQDFIQHLNSFSGDAGGSSYAPRVLRTRNVSINGVAGSERLVDFGFQAIMGADNDGDHVAYILGHGNYSNALESGMRSSGFESMDNMFKESWAAYEIASKESIEVLKGRYRNEGKDEWANQLEAAMQDVQKESASKTATGPLDVQLNNLRTSAMDLALREGDNDLGRRVTRLSGMLAAIQEHTLLKSKKLPVYFPFAEYLGDAIRTAMSDGGTTDALESVIRNNIFSGYNSTISVGSTTISIDEDLSTLRQVVDHAKASGWSEDISSGTLAAKLGGDVETARKSLNAIESGAGLTGAYVRGFAGDTIDVAAATAADFGARVSKAVSGFNAGKGTMIGLGIMGVGVAASLFAPSYSATPMTSIYDRPRKEIADSIADRSALQPSSQSLSTPDNSYAMMPRSVNERATYIGRQNSFQVRGTVNNRADIDNVMSVFKLGPLGGGHVTVGMNDNRRPITQNYVDRLLGMY